MSHTMIPIQAYEEPFVRLTHDCPRCGGPVVIDGGRWVGCLDCDYTEDLPESARI